jgi:hypothetical protein
LRRAGVAYIPAMLTVDMVAFEDKRPSVAAALSDRKFRKDIRDK